MNAQDVLNRARTAGVELIRFMYCDFTGVQRGKVTAIDDLANRLSHGINLTTAQMAFTLINGERADEHFPRHRSQHAKRHDGGRCTSHRLRGDDSAARGTRRGAGLQRRPAPDPFRLRSEVPYNYMQDMDFETMALLSERNLGVPGVNVTKKPVRQYLYGALGASLGYVGMPADLNKLPDINKFNFYDPDMEGKAQIELAMNDYLKGPRG